MGFYSQHIFPRLVDATLSGEEFRGRRKSLLADVAGEVFEIGFGSGLNLPLTKMTAVMRFTANPLTRTVTSQLISVK